MPSPRYVQADEIEPDAIGNPVLERRLFLLDTRLPEQEIEVQYPSLRSYLREGRKRGIDQRYLCRHRTPWYVQEHRPPAPIVCTYLGRSDSENGRPFRFILNRSKATIANVYLAMYPVGALAAALARQPELITQVWALLNRITPQDLLGNGRVYGGGLHKLEPKELSNVPVPELVDLLATTGWTAHQPDLFVVAAE